MKYEEFEILMKGFKVAFNKTYDEQELKFMYKYFKDYKPKAVSRAIDEIIQCYDKMPSLKQIIDVCERARLSVELQEEYEKIGTPEPDKEWYDLLNSFK